MPFEQKSSNAFDDMLRQFTPYLPTAQLMESYEDGVGTGVARDLSLVIRVRLPHDEQNPSR